MDTPEALAAKAMYDEASGANAIEELGQQSLIARPKPKSIIVPRGHGCWWGVDSSTRCVAIGTVVRDGARSVHQVPFPHLEGGQRLSAIYNDSRVLAHRLVAEHGLVPGLIGVEQPSGSGQKVNHELEFAVGVIIAGVYDGVAQACGAAAPMRLVVGSWWKLRACGRGDIRKTKKVPGRKKPVRLELEEYPVMQWARLNGYTGNSWDEADALGIAVALESEWDLVER